MIRKQNLDLIRKARSTIARIENLELHVEHTLAENLSAFDRLRVRNFQNELKRYRGNLIASGDQDPKWIELAHHECDECEAYLKLIGHEYAGSDAPD